MILDRIKGPLAAFVLQVMDFVRLHPLFAAKVVAQNGDGTLELQPDSDVLPQLSRVPIRWGIPGVTATVAAGARVLVGFENGDPARPIATLWDSASVTQLNINAGTIVLNGGASKVGRVGDPVRVTIPALSILVPSLTTPFFVPNPLPVTLDGTITDGVSSVKA
jgi:hypothetical protein